MAIISMCFNLIQEEMMAKIVLISTLCGRNKKTSQFNSNNSLQDEQVIRICVAQMMSKSRMSIAY